MNKPYDELVKEVEILKTQNEAYKIQLEDSQIDCENWMGLYAHKSKQYDMLDQEFEEAIRGSLLNLDLIKRRVETAWNTYSFDCDLEGALKVINTDISSLKEFAEKRWGHGEEE